MRHRIWKTAAAAAVLACFAVGCTSGVREEVVDQETLARGQYLVEGVMLCFACHSQLDWTRPGTPIVAGTKGGGAMFPEELPFPVVASNISPDQETGIGAWSDEEIARAVRDGIGRDGRVLFPAMPYNSFRALSDDDLAAVIAYLRSIDPVRNVLPKTELPEEIRKALVAPPPVGHVPEPDLSTPEKRGAYYVQLADCGGCHTPKGPDLRPVPGLELAGGQAMRGPWGALASANITPDASGVAGFDEELFTGALRTGRVGDRPLNNVMLWGFFRHMTDEDIHDIFAFLRTLPPVAHRVDNSQTPTPCKLCGGSHGLGDTNM